MKRFQLFLAGTFMAVAPLWAQTADDWQQGVAKVKQFIQTSPGQASEEAGRLLKGKNKKNVDLLVAIGRAYLEAGNTAGAETYLALAKKANSKSAAVSVFEGDLALAAKDAGRACQLYEQAIYFEPACRDAYLKFAEVYKAASPQLAIEKLEQLKAIAPADAEADKKLAEIYYLNNQFGKAAVAYARFADTPAATEDDLVKYSFALFLNHDFEKSLGVARKGLQKNARHAAFNRLAMYDYAELKRHDEALKAADAFFHASDRADYSYLDYTYYGQLLDATKQYDAAAAQYRKALALEPDKTGLWREISASYESAGEYGKAISAYRKYSASLSAGEQTPDILFQLGKLYYEKGTQFDTLTVTPAKRHLALVAADSVFAVIAQAAPESYLGNFWRARTHSALDPETTQGLAKPFYEKVVTLLLDKKDTRYNPALVECYSYLGYYYLVAGQLPQSKEYWNKILAIDPANATAKRALEGID